MTVVAQDFPGNSDSACHFIGVVVVEDAGNGDGESDLTWGSSNGNFTLLESLWLMTLVLVVVAQNIPGAS